MFERYQIHVTVVKDDGSFGLGAVLYGVEEDGLVSLGETSGTVGDELADAIVEVICAMQSTVVPPV